MPHSVPLFNGFDFTQQNSAPLQVAGGHAGSGSAACLLRGFRADKGQNFLRWFFRYISGIFVTRQVLYKKYFIFLQCMPFPQFV